MLNDLRQAIVIIVIVAAIVVGVFGILVGHFL